MRRADRSPAHGRRSVLKIDVRQNRSRQRGLFMVVGEPVMPVGKLGGVQLHHLRAQRAEHKAVIRSQAAASQRPITQSHSQRVDSQRRVARVPHQQDFFRDQERPSVPVARIQPVVIDGGGDEDGPQMLRNGETGRQGLTLLENAPPQNVQCGNRGFAPRDCVLQSRPSAPRETG